MKDIFELSETAISNTRGSTQLAGYTLQPVLWLKELIDAAKTKHFYAQYAKQSIVPEHTNSVIFPYRTQYIPNASWEADAAENATINWTTVNNMDGVEVTPSDHNGGVAISNRAIRRNALDLVRWAKDELMVHAGDLVDLNVRDAIVSSANQAAAGAGGRGAYTVYGGDARADSELTTGDTLTPDMIVSAKTKLHSNIMKYWTPGTPAAEAINANVVANPWKTEKTAPFVFAMAPEQEGTLLKDSQFMNACEFGDRGPIVNGYITSYVGIELISSANCKSFTAAGTAADGGGAAGATGHRCVMFKANTSAGLAWGLKPRLVVFDYPSELQKRMALEIAYASSAIQKDSICFVDVADE